MNRANTNKARLDRHRRMRDRVTDTAERPRLNVSCSAKNICAQIIGNVAEVALAVASTLNKEFTDNSGNREAAGQVGKLIVKRAAEKGIIEVVLDRGGYISHGRVRKLAEDAREGGLKF